MMRATPSNWKCLLFEDMAPIPYTSTFDNPEYQKLSFGLIPAVMEDKWFIYVDGDHLCLHRSWTGVGIFRVTLQRNLDDYVVTEALCAAEIVEKSDPVYQADLLNFLVRNLLLGDAIPFPTPSNRTETVHGLYQHAVSGTGYPATAGNARPWWKFWN